MLYRAGLYTILRSFTLCYFRSKTSDQSDVFVHHGSEQLLTGANEVLSLYVRQFLILSLLAVLLAACSRKPIELAGSPAVGVDFSGSWELNHKLSESVQDKTRFLLQMAEVQARSRRDGVVMGLPSMELVKLAEKISRATVLTIEQGEQQIEVKRGEEFPLTCTFNADMALAAEDPLGIEICGWQGHQLVFDFRLPEHLNVTHKLTLGPGGKNLNVATTVRSRGYGQVFTLNRVYTQFVPLADEFECEYTLTRGKSCRRATPDEPVSVTL
jgi:hypothetical protein